MNVNPYYRKYFLLIFILFQWTFSAESGSRNFRTGAREAALSDAVVSLPGVWSVFHNPAGMALSKRFQAAVYHESVFMLKDLSFSAGSVVIPAGNGNLGLGFLQTGFGSYHENRLIAAYGKRITQKIYTGIQLFGIAGTVPEQSGYRGWVSFGTGIIYSPASGIALGIYLFNPLAKRSGRTMEFPEDLFAFRIGGHYSLSREVLVSVEAEKQKDQSLRGKTGIEICPADNVFLRWGLSVQPVSFSFGTGYRYGNVMLDVAFRYHENLGVTPSLSLMFAP